LDFETRVIPNEGHSSNTPEGFTRGLQAVYAPVPIVVPGPILEQYSGKYQFPGWQCDIVKEQDKLYFVTPEGVKFVLNPTSENSFYTRGIRMVIHFKRSDAGRVTGFESEGLDGKNSFVEKVGAASGKIGG
jgi:hypothetical protein